MYACMDVHVKARQNENSLLFAVYIQFAMSQVIQATTMKRTDTSRELMCPFAKFMSKERHQGMAVLTWSVS